MEYEYFVRLYSKIKFGKQVILEVRICSLVSPLTAYQNESGIASLNLSNYSIVKECNENLIKNWL